MQIGLTAFMVALVASWSERKATALTTQPCALVPVDRTSLAHDMEQSAFPLLVWGRCSVALDRAHPAVAILLSSSKWRKETPRWYPT
jgi:hypothetical protein